MPDVRYKDNSKYSLKNRIQLIVCEHWPDTCEYITWTVELWNRWIRLSCYYNSYSI